MTDLGVSVEVAGKILAHKVGIMRGVDRVYQRSEFLPQRREAFEAWGSHVVSCAERATNFSAIKPSSGRSAYDEARKAKLVDVKTAAA